MSVWYYNWGHMSMEKSRLPLMHLMFSQRQDVYAEIIQNLWRLDSNAFFASAVRE